MIVNADALQVWGCWRVLSARPSPEEEARVPHRLYGHLPRGAPYSVGHWLREVEPLLGGPERPIIVGGTGLYLTALTEGLAEIPPVPPELRAEAEAPTRRGIHLVETLVGPMQAVFNGRLDPDRYVALASTRAPFVDRAFVDRVLERLRRLWGHWSATGFHEVMTLRWPPPG